MSTFTELMPATKSEKHAALTWDADARVLTVTGTRCHCRYRVIELAVSDGRGFILAKLDVGSDRAEERYGCLVAGSTSHCDCRGFTRYGRCKHLTALAELIAADQM